MGAHVIENAFFSINGVDLSDHVRSATLSLSTDAPEATAMGGGGARVRLCGLDDWDVSLQFNQDFDAAKVDATFWAVRAGRAAVAVVMRPDAGTKSATNPEYSGNVILTGYSPLEGSVGDVHVTGPTMQAAGALTRSTS